MPSPSQPIRPLEGTLVVSLEHAIAAPFCTRQLADLGARVIKVERPDGGDFARHYDDRIKGLSSHFVWVNRGKESVTLDLKSSEDRALLERMLARADVFVQNMAPGATERMGLGAQQLRERFPRLIICAISGFGQDGPYRDRRAYDLLIQAEAGLLSVTGTEHELAKVGCSIADIAAGMVAYSSILSALLLRAKTGEGSIIDVSMLEALSEWMSFPLNYSFEGASAPARTGAAHATIYPYGPFAVGDQNTVMLGVQNEREWQRFCEQVLMQPELVGDPRFASNPLRSAHRDELKRIIENVFDALALNEVETRLADAQIAYARVNTMADLWNHPQLAARQRWRTVASAAGHFQALLPPGQSSQFEALMGPVPALGEHTERIRDEFGKPSSQP